MSNSWPTVPIKKTYVALFDGPHATPKPSDEGPVFLGIGNITGDGHLDLTDVRHIAEEDYPTWTRRVTPREGDIVFTYEATLNRYAIIPEGFRGCLGRRLALIRPNSEAVDTRFLYYSFFGPAWRRTISKNTLTGATVDRIPLVRFPNFEIALPTLSTQRCIALILSAYDHLIENNTRRIAILEEIARLIYREWFVEFRFPGHEKVRTAESGVGSTRKGWQTKRVDAVYRTVLGGTPARGRDEFWAGGTVPWINSGKVNEIRILSPSELITPLALERSATKLMPSRTTVIAITGATLGQVSLLEAEMCANQSVVGVFDPEKRRNEYAYLMFKERIGALIKHASGGAQQHINKEIVNEMVADDPPAHLLDRFRELITPAFDLIANLLRKNANLRATRDLLLPKLVSGEVDVSHRVKEQPAFVSA